MSKEEIFSNLTTQQCEFFQFLLDTAYSNGYTQATIDINQHDAKG